MMLTSFLFLTASIQRQNVATKSPETLANEAWVRHLDRFFAADPRLVVVDLPTNLKPHSLGLDGARREGTVLLVAAVLGRDEKDLSGATVLRRRIEDITGAGAEPAASLADWLRSADGSERSRLFSASGTSFNSLSPAGKRACGMLAGTSSGLTERVLGGEAVQVAARITPVVEFRDEEGYRHTVPVKRYEEYPMPPTAESGSGKGDERKDGPAKGKLQPGRLTTLGDLTDQLLAEQATYVQIDSRLRATAIYVRGPLKGGPLLSAVVELARIPEPLAVPYRRSDRVAALSGSLEDALTKARSAGLGRYLDGQNTTMADLESSDPELFKRLQAQGVSSDAKVRLTYAVAVNLGASGSGPSLYGSGPDAKEPNQTGFLITR